MANWNDTLSHLSARAGQRIEELRGRMCYQLGGLAPFKVIPDRGYGTTDQFYLTGQVIEDQPAAWVEKNDKLWDALPGIYQRLETTQVPNARLSVRCGSVEKEVKADRMGCFDISLTPGTAPVKNRLWHPVEITLLAPQPETQRYPIRAVGEVLVPREETELAIVFDIDNTIWRTDTAFLRQAARDLFLGRAITRSPLAGSAALSRAFYHGMMGNLKAPVFYLSNGPRHLYELFTQFSSLLDIPTGPTLFTTERHRASSGEAQHAAVQKDKIIRRLLQTYAEMRFVLISEYQQEGSERLARLCADFPGRIPAIYLYDTGRDPQCGSHIWAQAKHTHHYGTEWVAAVDCLTFAQHAASRGWITTLGLEEVAAGQKKDLEPARPIDKMPGATAKRGQSEKQNHGTASKAGVPKDVSPKSSLSEKNQEENVRKEKHSR